MDYAKLGFKAGVEIHQRLATRCKLFCACPTESSEEKPKNTLNRRLRAVAGELGEIDPAAAFEAARGKSFVYETFAGNSCLVEEDEEPPRALNDEALDAVVRICNGLGARVLDEVHVMRKTVVDGSAVSAFQRTALVGVNGAVQTSEGPVGVQTVCLEEESAGIVEKAAGEARYRLDRLGIPLVEIATDASLKNPEHVRETAERIGLLLRSSEHVQRGIGTIRQDLNVSITGGARVEIKGAQELSELQALVENEVLRQKNLLVIRAELERRGFKAVAFGKPHSVSHVFANAKPFLSDQLKKASVAMAVKLLFCKGLLGREIMQGHRFGTELADYARVQGVRGIVHCDEDPAAYGLTPTDFEMVSRELDCIEDDGWAVVVADESRAIRALRAVFDRAFSPVLKETRRAEGVVSRFMRPLPGSARMYPETDVLPVSVPAERVRRAGGLRSFEERKQGLVARGLNAELAEKILRSPEALAFEKLASKFKVEPKALAWILADVKPALRREGFTELRVEEALALLEGRKITKAAIPDLLKVAAKEPAGVLLEDLAKAGGLLRITGQVLGELAASLNNDFGEVMKRYRLQVDAGELKSLLGGSKRQ